LRGEDIDLHITRGEEELTHPRWRFVLEPEREVPALYVQLSCQFLGEAFNSTDFVGPNGESKDHTRTSHIRHERQGVFTESAIFMIVPPLAGC
jgi:hypothetical protein